MQILLKSFWPSLNEKYVENGYKSHIESKTTIIWKREFSKRFLSLYHSTDII